MKNKIVIGISPITLASAAIYAMNNLLLPASTNTGHYDDVTKVLDEINSNKNEVY